MPFVPLEAGDSADSSLVGGDVHPAAKDQRTHFGIAVRRIEFNLRGLRQEFVLCLRRECGSQGGEDSD